MPRQTEPVEIVASAETRNTPRLTRRAFVAGSAAGVMAVSASAVALADHVRDTPTATRPAPEENTRFFSAQEVELAFRNYGHLAEYLDRPITPLGAHYLLILRCSEPAV